MARIRVRVRVEVVLFRLKIWFRLKLCQLSFKLIKLLHLIQLIKSF